MPAPEHERLPGLHTPRDGDQSDPAIISDIHKLSYSSHVDYLHPEHSNVSPLRIPLVSRDWQQHHQGRNYGWIIGGILGLVIVCLAGAYAIVRWRRIRARKLSMTSRQSEMTPSKGSHVSVDSAPLLITSAEHWVPTLRRISEHMEEPSASSTLPKEPTIGSLEPVRSATSCEKDMRSNMYPLRKRPSEEDSSHLPEPLSYLHNGLGAHDRNQCEDDSRLYEEEPSFSPYKLQAHPEDELETPNVSASDSDSMQVNIPWRSSTRFVPDRTQSLQLESQKLSSPLTSLNPRHSYSLPQPSHSSTTPRDSRHSISQPQSLYSPLYLRAVAEERQRPQSSSRSPTMPSRKGRQSFEDSVSMNESEGSETASTMSSLARLKLRLTGSAPFLPLIQEYSPLDTDSLWRRFRGDTPQSTPISLIPSRGTPWSTPKPPSSSNPLHSRPHSPLSHSSSRFSHSIIAPSSKPASQRSTSPKSVSPQPASPISPSPPKPAPASSFSFPTLNHDRTVSPKPSSPIVSPTSTSEAASPTVNISPDVPTMSSPTSYPPPWQSHSSALTTSYDTNTSTSSLPLRDLSDFPLPPVTRPFPRSLPRRPLPYIPPPPSYLPPQPPVMVLDQEKDVEPSETNVHSPQ